MEPGPKPEGGVAVTVAVGVLVGVEVAVDVGIIDSVAATVWVAFGVFVIVGVEVGVCVIVDVLVTVGVLVESGGAVGILCGLQETNRTPVVRAAETIPNRLHPIGVSDLISFIPASLNSVNFFPDFVPLSQP